MSSQASTASPSPNARPTKRRLVDALESADRKRAKTSLLKEFLDVARWIGRSEDVFLDFSMTFKAGMPTDGTRSDSEEEPEDIPDYERHLRIYALLKQRIAGFNRHTDPIHDQPDKLNSLTKAMTKALGSARSDDASSLKEAGLAYIALDTPGLRIDPIIPPKASKSERGFTHPVLARLLCPMRLVSDFDTDPTNMMKKLEDGRIPVTSMDFPAFLYPNGAVYNPDDIDDGLCRGPLVVRVWKHIFTSPSSATRSAPGAGRTKSCQAKMNNLTAVTPRTIAYAAMHVRWLMCVQDDWRTKDGIFDKKEFYEMITELFNFNLDEMWCHETLAWWNKQVFKETRVLQPAQALVPSDAKRLLAQRQAKNRMRSLSTDHVSRPSSPCLIPRSSPEHFSPPISPPPSSPRAHPSHPLSSSPPRSAVATTSNELLPPTPAIRHPGARTSNSRQRVESESDLSPAPPSPPQRKPKGKSKPKPLPATAPPKTTRKSKK